MARTSGQPAPDELRVVSWNVSWFGHPDHLPVDDALQIAHVADVLVRLRPDVIALQEVASVAAFHRLTSLLTEPYVGMLTTAGGDQRIGALIRADRLRILSVNEAALDDASFAFAGRPPLFIHLEKPGSAVEHDLLLGIVHLKAFSDVGSYERRLQAVERLVRHVSTQTDTPRVLIIGDFNDRSDESTARFRRSPLELFMDGFEPYHVLSAGMEARGRYTFCTVPDCSTGWMLDHAIVSEPLGTWSPSLEVLDTLLQFIPNYVATTSDHLPLLLTLTPPAAAPTSNASRISALFPNPARDAIQLEVHPGPAANVEIVDLLGRVQQRARLEGSAYPRARRFSLVQVPAGAYVLRLNSEFGEEWRTFVRVH